MRRVGRWLAVAMLLGVAACTSDGDRRTPPDDDCVQPTSPAASGWACTFADEFVGTALDPDRWVLQETATSGYGVGPECYGDPANVAVADGRLSLTVRRLDVPVACPGHPVSAAGASYTGASVSTYRRFTQTYGRFEIRARFPDVAVPGIHSALWLYPESTMYGPWPQSGEIDVAEYFSAYPDRVIPVVHYPRPAPDPTATNQKCVVEKPSDWHVYAAEWTPRGVTVWFDGRLCLSHRWNPAPPLVAPAPFDKPFLVSLTQALGVSGTANQFDPARTPLPATLQVDYVRVWQRD